MVRAVCQQLVRCIGVWLAPPLRDVVVSCTGCNLTTVDIRELLEYGLGRVQRLQRCRIACSAFDDWNLTEDAALRHLPPCLERLQLELGPHHRFQSAALADRAHLTSLSLVIPHATVSLLHLPPGLQHCSLDLCDSEVMCNIVLPDTVRTCHLRIINCHVRGIPSLYLAKGLQDLDVMVSSGDDSAALGRVLQTVPSSAPLRRLRLRQMIPLSPHSVVRLLQMHRQTLQQVELNVTLRHRADDLARLYTSVGCMASLQHLTLRLSGDDPPLPILPPAAWAESVRVLVMDVQHLRRAGVPVTQHPGRPD